MKQISTHTGFSPRKTRGDRIMRWLLTPFARYPLFMAMGVASWLLLYGLTDWTSDGWWVWLPVLVADFYLLTLAVCLLPRKWRGWVFGLLYLVIFLTGFAESFIYQRYYMHFTPQTLAMIRETTPEESGGFIKLCFDSPVFWKTLAWWTGLLALFIGLGLVWRKRPTPRFFQRGALAVVGLCALWWIPSRVTTTRFLLLDDTSQAERTDFSAFYSTPWRVVYALKFDRLAQKELHTLSRNMLNIKVDSVGQGVPYIVFVIGESYNKHHSAVYGYPLPTTPFQCRAREEGNMVAMTDATTPWNVTSMVFKQLFSTRSSDEAASWTDGVLFPAVLRRGGYTVWFMSNQFYKSNRQSSADYNGSFFLNKQPFDSLCFNNRNPKHYLYDIGLLNTLPKDPVAPRQFIILHLMGQHQPYADRTPKARVKFKKTDIKRPDLTAGERQIVADYDNATLENDYVLERLYQRFADKPAIIVYTADHGEEVYDGHIGMFGRNHSAEPTPEILWAEFEVPLEFFVTPALQKQFPSLMASIRAAKDKPFSIDDLSHTFLRLAGISCPYYNARRDILSPRFTPRPRKIKNLRATFDQIINSNPR